MSCFSAGHASAACKEQSLGGSAAWTRVDKLFEKWSKDPANSNLKDWEWKKNVDLGDGKKTLVTYGVTHQGNGSIKIRNLLLRTYRDHDGEGFTYNPAALRVRLSPGPTGCRLSVSGNIDLLHEDGEKLAGHKQADLAYDLDARTGRFHIAPDHKQGFDEIDLSLQEK